MMEMNIIDSINSLHTDLQKAKKRIYDKHHLIFTNPELLSESVEYGACSFQLNGKIIQHRVSKITPIKTGQFVTVWKRGKDGITQPFDISDELDFIIITARNENNFGQFIFPKSVLIERGVITNEGKGGKRGMRVYPPWDLPTSKQAIKNQNWQTKYFLTIKEDGSTNFEFLKNIFGC